jgi:hypothetical protein
MKRKVLLIIVAISLGCVWVGEGAAGQIGYRMKEDVGFALKPPPGPPSSAVVAFDAILGRPLGLATTIGGAGVFLVTLPFSVPSKSVEEAAWGLVGRPGAWTFVRPLGRGAPEFEEQGVFRP